MTSRRNRDRPPARRPPSRPPRRRLLVVCEGTRTEPEYIRGFERHVRNAAVVIEIPREQGDPRRVVEIAKSKKAQADADARKNKDDFLRFDEVWCVFDRDEWSRFSDACAMARDNGFELAVSNPCVELWLLLHLRDSPGPQDRHHVQDMLGELLPGYDKGVDFSKMVGGIAAATDRARRLDADAETAGEPHRNPTTGFYRLTDSIGRTEQVKA